MSGLKALPEGQVWFRVAGFGADATGVGMSRYIEAIWPFHELGRPIVADQVGGIAGLAASAFGAVSDFAHGIEGKQRFSAGDWLKDRKGGGGGHQKRIYLSGLDRWLDVASARQLFSDARTARRIFGCSDLGCCGDIEKMLSNPEARFMFQRSRAVGALSTIPESVRTDQFLDNHLELKMKEAKRATKLKKVPQNHQWSGKTPRTYL